jgi:hypothetical protein
VKPARPPDSGASRRLVRTWSADFDAPFTLPTAHRYYAVLHCTVLYCRYCDGVNQYLGDLYTCGRRTVFSCRSPPFLANVPWRRNLLRYANPSDNTLQSYTTTLEDVCKRIRGLSTTDWSNSMLGHPRSYPWIIHLKCEQASCRHSHRPCVLQQAGNFTTVNIQIDA